MHYDVKAFLRELALTRVYQRSSEPPPGTSPGDDSAGASTFVVASLKTETPEQLAWSVMQGLGLVAQTRLQVEEKLDGHDPKMRAIFQTDARRRALRVTMIEEGVHDQLQKNVAPFVRQFAAAAGQPQDATEPTVHQALFLSNGHHIQTWLAPSSGSLVGRLAGLSDPSAIADELYLSLYTRRPTDEERAEVGPLSRRPRQRARARLARAGLGPADIHRVPIQPLTWLCRQERRRESSALLPSRGDPPMRCTYACGSADHLISRRSFLGRHGRAWPGIGFLGHDSARRLGRAHAP